MHYSIISVLVLGLSALSEAKFSKPSKGDKVTVGESETISWETAGIGSLIDIVLIPAGAVDTTTIITQIASSVNNTGSYQWTPPTSISTTDCAIAVVDLISKITVISESFTFIFTSGKCYGNSCHKGYGNDKTVTQLSTVTKVSTAVQTQQVTQLSVATSLVTVQNNLTAAVSTVLITQTNSYLTTLTTAQAVTNSIDIIIINGASVATNAAAAASTVTETFTSTPLVIASSAAAETIAPFANSTTPQVNATAPAAAASATAPAVFTGAASPMGASSLYSLIGACLVGVVGMALL